MTGREAGARDAGWREALAGRAEPPPLGSVVIAARNEEAVIGRCLAPLAPAAASGIIEVAVVCNGCSDRTAEIASGFPGLRVLQLPQGSKPAALRAADRAVTAFPRIYLDADVVLPLGSAMAVLRRLAPATLAAPLAARPPVRFDLSGADWAVRRYYRARAAIPAVLGSLWGAGVYAISETGRARFAEFPDLIADDLWVDQLFDPAEIEIVDCEPVTITTPGNVRALLAVLSRVYRGNAEHLAARPATARRTAGGTIADVARLARRGPGRLLDAATYSGLALSARLGAHLGRARAAAGRWERDDSSRHPRGGAGEGVTS